MKALLILTLSTLTLAAMAETDQNQQIQKRALVVKDRIAAIERIDVTAEKPLVDVKDGAPAVMAILKEVKQLEAETTEDNPMEE